MKKILCLATVFLFVMFCVGAQEHNVSNSHYEVYSSGDDAECLINTLDGLFNVFNDTFRFDETLLKNNLKVRKYGSIEEFKEYLSSIPFDTAVNVEEIDDFVYLHYSNSKNSELVIFDKEDENQFNASLAHQAFVQYLKAFVENPPLWLMEGFAVYFEKTVFDADNGVADYIENTEWLQTIKDYNNDKKIMPISEVMFKKSMADLSEEEKNVFYPQAWSLVSFFMDNEDFNYKRLMIDFINILKQNQNITDNTDKDVNTNDVYSFYCRWVNNENEDKGEVDYQNYLNSCKTKYDLLEEAIALYKDENYSDAKIEFEKVLDKDDTDYVANYYLGLIAYRDIDYSIADEMYKKALEYAPDQDEECKNTIKYALGLNYSELRDVEKAEEYLSPLVDHPDYGSSAKLVLDRLNIQTN